MRIGAIADLHVDRHESLEPRDYLMNLIEVAEAQQLDLLIIAGDISNTFELTHNFITEFQQSCRIPIRFIPGNHDYWTSETHTSSQEILQRYMEMETCLMTRPYMINENWAIVGNTAWYDHRYGNHERFSEARLDRGKFKGATWQDKERINWEYSDRSLSQRAVAQAREDLEQVRDKQIILVTHIVTHPRFVVPTPHRIFDFFNAFIGTRDFDELYQDFPIRYSIMGHVHFRKQIEEKGVRYICPCLGYPRQWRTPHISREINDTLAIIELED
ncbi:metallophosphoesterase [Staphylococcus auricularis]|uniref:metallophosphoesterase n=1 Tax=Staphylococcus auricularis TaxID=29379 RepID=UPI003EBB5AD1